MPEIGRTAEQASWWDDPLETRAEVRGGLEDVRQAEFWVDEDLRVPATMPRNLPSRKSTEPVSTERVEAVEEERQVVEEKVLERAARPARSRGARRTTVVRRRRGTGFSMFSVARFLKINGSVRDGRDIGRGLDLPESPFGARCKLTQFPAGPVTSVREIRSLPSEFGWFVTR